MIDPYKMIAVNLLLSTLLLTTFLLYSKLLHRNVNYFIALILISILPIVSIFRKGVYESGDFVFHIYRSMSFLDSLKDGILIPSWAANLNDAFGYPVFLFIYNVPYYLINILYLTGLSYISSEKIILALAYIGSGISMWFLLKKITKNELASFAGSIIYLFAPYHLVDLHFRVAISETIAFFLCPVIFYLVLQLIEKNRKIYILWIGLLSGILFSTHPPMFIFYLTIFGIYIVYKVYLKKAHWKVILYFSVSIFIAFCISLYSIMPRLTLIPYTTNSILIESLIDFVTPRELLFSTWRFGFLFQGHFGELSFIIGYSGLIILFISFFLLLKKRGGKYFRELFFWNILSIVIIFLMLSYSKPIWDLIPILRLMQFSYRLLHPLAFCIAIITAYVTLIYINKKYLIYIFLLFSIGYTLLNWGHRQMIQGIDDSVIRKNLPASTKEGEQNFESVPIWWYDNRNLNRNRLRNFDILNGESDFKEISRNSQNHVFLISAKTDSTVSDNTAYFPGWTVKLNGEYVPINFNHKKSPSTIVFNIPKGLHLVTVAYNDIWQIELAKRISSLSFLIVALSIIFYYAFRINQLIAYLKRLIG